MTERRYDPDASARTTGGGWRPRRPTEPDVVPAAGRAASGAVAHRAGALLDLQRWAGNRAVAALASPAGRPRPGVLQRQPAPAGPMTRDRFVETLRSRYGVARVRAGTFAEQQGVNSRPNVASGGRLTERVWQPWDPGATSEVYESILTAFGDLESAFGGIPPVDEL